MYVPQAHPQTLFIHTHVQTYTRGITTDLFGADLHVRYNLGKG